MRIEMFKDNICPSAPLTGNVEFVFLLSLSLSLSLCSSLLCFCFVLYFFFVIVHFISFVLTPALCPFRFCILFYLLIYFLYEPFDEDGQLNASLCIRIAVRFRFVSTVLFAVVFVPFFFKCPISCNILEGNNRVGSR